MILLKFDNSLVIYYKYQDTSLEMKICSYHLLNHELLEELNNFQGTYTLHDLFFFENNFKIGY